MPSKKRNSKRRSKKTSRSPYKYNKKNNLLRRVSKRKYSNKRTNKRTSSNKKYNSKHRLNKSRRIRSSSFHQSRRRLHVKTSPRKLVDISAFTRNSIRRKSSSRNKNNFQKVNNRKSAKKYRLTVGGTPRKSRVHSITTSIRKITTSPAKYYR